MKILYYDCFYGINEQDNLEALMDLRIDKVYIDEELEKIKYFESNKSPEFYISFQEALDKIETSHLNNNVKGICKKIIKALSVACSRLININLVCEIEKLSEINFYNIVATAICIDFIKPDIIISSKIEIGGGMKKINEAILPVPSLLTMELLKSAEVKNDIKDREVTTPLGAAIISAIADKYSNEKSFKIMDIGYGKVEIEGEARGPLRIFIGESYAENNICSDTGCIEDIQYIIECNIDDMNPELYDFILVKFFNAGAKDAFMTPIIMKKGRPAVKLSILCTYREKPQIEELIFKETTSFGIRSYKVEKKMLERNFSKVETKYGKITVKNGFYKGKWIKAKAEYDECRKKAEELGISITEVYREIGKSIDNVE